MISLTKMPHRRSFRMLCLALTLVFSCLISNGQAQAQTQAALFFINNSGPVPRNNLNMLLESIAVSISREALQNAYHRTVFLIGNSAGRDNLSYYLNYLLSSFNRLDVFVLAHGSGGPAYNNDNAFYGADKIGAYDLLQMVNSLSSSVRTRLRAVYQMNCYAWYLNITWRAMGAAVVSGAKSINANAALEYPSWVAKWSYNYSYLSVRDLSWLASWWLDLIYRPLRPDKPVDSYKYITGDAWRSLMN